MSLQHLTRAIIETLQISVPTVVDSARGDLTPERCDVRLASWSKRLLDQAGICLDVRGLEHMPDGAAFIVMSNHQSLYDIPVLFQALPGRVRMVAKAELFKIPIWSRAMRCAGFIEVDRKQRNKAIASLRAAQRSIQQGTSIWIAPEGTRSTTGALLPFKKGGFHMALTTGTRILPVTIDGTRDVLTARAFQVKTGCSVRVTVSEPIDPRAYGKKRTDDLMLAVRQAIAQHLPNGALS